MIVYFMDRKLNILGAASTYLPDALPITDDIREEEVETGAAAFECEITYDQKSRAQAAAYTQPGQYIIRSADGEQEFYQILSRETNTEEQTIRTYAEDAGLDLINVEALIVSDGTARTMREWVSYFTASSGFEIGSDESGDETKLPWWDAEATVTERLLDLAETFGYEIYFSFQIDRLTVSHKYINIVKQRGADNGIQLHLNREVDSIVSTETVENVATSLLCVGGTEDGTQIPVTLEGYSYDDGDIYTDGRYIRSRSAVQKWGRFVSGDTTDHHIERVFRLDTVSQEYLCTEAVKELKKVSEMEINYDIDIKALPESVRIGDRINIVDEAGELFVSARLLRLETSVTQNKYEATLGEYLIKSGGIPERIAELSARFSELAAARALYTWVAYADDESGTGISLDPVGKSYTGMSPNHIDETPDLSDPSKYTWQYTRGATGAAGEDSVTMRIDSSKGVLFKSDQFETDLSVVIYYGTQEIKDTGALHTAFGAAAYLQWKWQKDADDDFHLLSVSDSRISRGGFLLSLTPDDVDEKIIFACDLEL